MRTLGLSRKVCEYLPAGRQVYEVAKSYGFNFGTRKEKAKPARTEGTLGRAISFSFVRRRKPASAPTRPPL